MEQQTNKQKANKSIEIKFRHVRLVETMKQNWNTDCLSLNASQNTVQTTRCDVNNDTTASTTTTATTSLVFNNKLGRFYLKWEGFVPHQCDQMLKQKSQIFQKVATAVSK